MITPDGIKADLATLENATPYLRSICAFILYLRYGPSMGRTPEISVEASHMIADLFIDRLKANVEASK